jgi:GNAT superfamily N-acetyltransferase
VRRDATRIGDASIQAGRPPANDSPLSWTITAQDATPTLQCGPFLFPLKFDRIMTTTVRRASRDDAGFLAWVMLSASRAHLSRGVWDLVIGSDDAGCLEYLRRLAVAEPRSLCHYESFWVVEADGQPGAALSGFDMGAHGWGITAEAMSRVQHDLGWTDADVAASQKRMAPVWACFLPDVGADWGIENVATLPERRGHGLASALMDRALREGRERGFRLAQITTLIGNDTAQTVYRRSGFRVSDEKPCPELLSVLDALGFVRLIREL